MSASSKTPRTNQTLESESEIVVASPETLELIREHLATMPELRKRHRRYAEGEVLFREKAPNKWLVVVLEGELVLRKTTTETLQIDRLGPGALAGIMSFSENRPSFSECAAATEAEVLLLEETWLKPFLEDHHDFSRLFNDLLIKNLVARYKRIVGLHLEIAQLSKALEKDRNELRETVEDLKRTRNQLIHQEKLATLGQLLAGIAHEINNPGASLSHGTEHLIKEIPAAMEPGGPLEADPDNLKFLRAALEGTPSDNNRQREALARLEKKYPRLKRTLLRRLSHLPGDLLDSLQAYLAQWSDSRREGTLFQRLQVFELGRALRTVRVSTDRILGLVTSLKNYGRPDDSGSSEIDVREGIGDTVTILGNRLKHFESRLELKPIPRIRGHAGELNQVWTNLLVNALDATPEGGVISVKTGSSNDRIWVEFHDSGPGVPKHLREKVFDTNFTTKKGKTDFGLGLGLAIAREIVHKHGGHLSIDDSPCGGALFRVTLPAKSGS